MCSLLEGFLREGERVLDLGCGSGILAKELEKKFKVKILGIDILDQRIVKIPFLIYDGEKIPFLDDTFDLILISFVLHHTQDPIKILNEAKRVGKRIIIFEDIPEGIFGKIRCWIHLLSWKLFFGGNSKFNFFKEKEWEEIFERLELKLKNKFDFSPKFRFLDPIKRKVFILEK